MITVLGKKTVSKGCVRECDYSAIGIIFADVEYKCCNEDGCNKYKDACNSARRFGISFLALLGSTLWALLTFMKFYTPWLMIDAQKLDFTNNYLAFRPIHAINKQPV